MSINLDIIRNLDSNKTYYLSNATGEVKEAGFWQKLKCTFGVKSALLKVTNLVESVRTSLLREAGIKSNEALDEDIRSHINLKSSVKGSLLKDLVTRFSVADEATILKNKAIQVARNNARNVAWNLSFSHPEIGDYKALSMIFSHALKPALQNDFPAIREAGKQPQLKTAEFSEQSIKPLKKTVARLLRDISQSTKLGNPKIDSLYAKHIMDTLFNEDGTRNEKGIDDLKSPEQVRMEHSFQIASKDPSRSQAVYSILQKKGIDPIAKLNTVLGYCGGDKDLESIVLEVAPVICVNSLDKVRSDEDIKAKIGAIRDNLDELRALGYAKDGMPQIFKVALMNLDGGAFPAGMLTKVAAQVKSTSLTPFYQLKGFSTADEIHVAVDETRKMLTRIFANDKVKKMFTEAGDTEVGGPQTLATRLAAMGMLLARLDISTQQRMANALSSTEASKMQGILKLLEQDMHIKSNTVYTDPAQRKYLKDILLDDLKSHEICLTSLHFALGSTMQCIVDEDVDVNEGPAIDIRIYLDELWDQEGMKNQPGVTAPKQA